MTTDLYSWANPLSFAPFLDHTWVTNQSTHNTQTPPAPEYWYCWGEAHTTTTGQLTTGAADLTVAQDIMGANAPALPTDAKHYEASTTMGAIVYYGLDGVCHQTANQVLAATGSLSTEPVRVTGANGYPLSTFFFGTYGTNLSGWQTIVDKTLPGIKLAGDDFTPFLDQAVPAEKQAKVMEYRLAAQLAIVGLRALVVAGHVKNFYPAVAVITGGALYKLKKYLTDAEFEALFPSVDFDNDEWLLPPLE